MRFRLSCTGLVFNLDAGRVGLLHSPAACSLSRDRTFTVHRTFTAHSTQHTANSTQLYFACHLCYSPHGKQTLYKHCLRIIEFYEVRIKNGIKRSPMLASNLFQPLMARHCQFSLKRKAAMATLFCEPHVRHILRNCCNKLLTLSFVQRPGFPV